jgi:hypothetical protein
MAVVTEVLQQMQGLVGIVIITLGAWVLSEDRRGRPGFRWILGALLLQVVVALVVVRVPFVWSVIGLANHAVAAIEKATLVGSSYMFGYTGGAAAPFVLKEGAASPLIIAFQILPLIIVYSALAALLCGSAGALLARAALRRDAFAGQHQRCGTVGDRRGVGRGHRAVLDEGGLQMGDLFRASLSGLLVGSDHYIAAAARNRHGGDLAHEKPLGNRGLGAAE